MICSNCGMIIGVMDKKCAYCLQVATRANEEWRSSVPSSQSVEITEPEIENREEPDNTSMESVKSEISLAEKYGLLGQKRVLATSRGARLGLFNTKICTEITYGSDGLMIQQRPARIQSASRIAYDDIVSVTTKRTISTYWIILMVLGVMIAIPSAGMGLLFTIAAFFFGRDHTVCIEQKNGSTFSVASANGTDAKTLYTELQKLKGM